MTALLGEEFQPVPLPEPNSRRRALRNEDVEWHIGFGKRYAYTAELRNWFGQLSLLTSQSGEFHRISAPSREWIQQVFEVIRENCPPEKMYRGINPPQ